MGLVKIKSNRTFNEIITVACAEIHHWQLLCDLANNDYDISYFGGKVTVADNLVTFLRDIEYEFNLQEVVEYLYNELTEVARDYEETYKGEDYNIHNENYKGAMEELKFLLRYCYQEYCEEIYYL